MIILHDYSFLDPDHWFLTCPLKSMDIQVPPTDGGIIVHRPIGWGQETNLLAG